MTMFSVEDHRLTKAEATWIGQAAGTELQELSADALRVLASRYFDQEFADAFCSNYYGACSDPGDAMFVMARLNTLAAVMGEETFRPLAVEKHAEWVQMCAEADATIRALTPCVTCGRSRNLADEVCGSPLCAEESLCGKCGDEKWEREHPSFSTGGDGDQPLEDDDLPV
jgi:hypothetical protein